MAAKSTGIDVERNYVTVCIRLYKLQLIVPVLQNCLDDWRFRSIRGNVDVLVAVWNFWFRHAASAVKYCRYVDSRPIRHCQSMCHYTDAIFVSLVLNFGTLWHFRDANIALNRMSKPLAYKYAYHISPDTLLTHRNHQCENMKIMGYARAKGDHGMTPPLDWGRSTYISNVLINKYECLLTANPSVVFLLSHYTITVLGL